MLSLQDVNKDDMPHFGKPLMSSAYLFVDNDNEQFTVWKSKAGTDTRLVAVGPSTCSPSPPVSTSTVSPEPVPPAPSPSPSPVSDGRASTGAIAGGVVGGLAALALSFIALYILARRRRKRRQALEQEEEAAKSEELKKATGDSYFKPEMPSDRQPPQEMPLTSDPRYGLAPYELPPSQEHSELSSRRDTKAFPTTRNTSISKSPSSKSTRARIPPQEMSATTPMRNNFF